MKKSKMYLLASVLGLVITTLAVSSLAHAYQDDPSVEGPKFGNGRSEEMQAEREAMQTAIESGDYDAWKEIVDSRPRITDVINQDNFDQFVEMHQLMQDGDRDGAQAIAEELGLPGLGGMGRGGHGPRMGSGPGHGDCPFADDQE